MSKHILISRTDAIGDVVLTLPMCGIIKEHYPSYTISFLGNNYTKDVILASKYVDHFINIDEWNIGNDKEAVAQLRLLNIDTIIHVFPKSRIAKIAAKAGIITRTGTKNRIYHWFTCNKLISLSRKNSTLHEAQLNLKLLEPLHIKSDFRLSDLPKFYGFINISELEKQHSLLSDSKFNILIHPGSRGSAMEWSLENYELLIDKLSASNKYNIFITGSAKEQILLSDWVKSLGNKVTDVTGKFTLKQFIAFIKSADGLVASSTGPLHLAAAMGIHALGLYTNSPSVNAGRWAPVGIKAVYIEADGKDINSIKPEMVYTRIKKWGNG